MKKVRKVLDHASSDPCAILAYRKSDIILAIHSDASYMSGPGTRSHAGGHFFMTSDFPIPPDNGAVLNTEQLSKAVMTSVAEAEMGALYINRREAVPVRMILQGMGHSQPRTPM